MTGIKTTEQKQSRMLAHELRRNFAKVSSEEHEMDEYGFVYEREEGAVGLNNSHSGPYSLYPAGNNPSMLHLCLDWKAPWQPPGSGVAGKGCFYLLMRSVPGALCLSASVSPHLPCAVDGGGSGGYECLPSDTNAIFTHLCPGLRGALFDCRTGCEVVGWEGLLVLGSAL